MYNSARSARTYFGTLEFFDLRVGHEQSSWKLMYNRMLLAVYLLLVYPCIVLIPRCEEGKSSCTTKIEGNILGGRYMKKMDSVL